MKQTQNFVPDTPSWSVFPELVPSGEVTLMKSRTRRHSVSTALTRSRDHETPSEELGQIRASTLSFTNMNEHGDLLVKYLMARKKVFIDQLHWDLPQADDMEFDQYDTPQCRWIIVHEFGRVLGGVRLLPTTAACGTYSYMLRDAQRGLLTDIPSDVLFFEAPVEPWIWEASRLFIMDSVPAHRRSRVQFVLMRQMSITARDLQAKHVIGIVPSVWARWLRRLGMMYAVPVGPKFEIDGTVSQSALFNVVEQGKGDNSRTDTGGAEAFFNASTRLQL